MTALIISQNFFRNFTFEIIDYFKCCSNRLSRPQLNQMLEFSLNRPTTNINLNSIAVISRIVRGFITPILCFVPRHKKYPYFTSRVHVEVLKNTPEASSEKYAMRPPSVPDSPPWAVKVADANCADSCAHCKF